MGQDDIAYDTVKDGVGTSVAVSIFADRAHLRDEISDDVRAAGLTVRDCGPVAALLEDEVRPLGLVVLLDCATGSGTELAALSRLDARAARSNIHLIVSTTVAALEDVFACCDQSAAQILVEPSRVERLVALGRALASASKPRVRELSEGDRLTLLRLIEQVSEIAERVGVKGAAGAARSASKVRPPIPGAPRPRTATPASAAQPVRRFRTRRWCARSSASGSFAPAISTASSSPIPRGTSCSISPPLAPSTSAFR